MEAMNKRTKNYINHSKIRQPINQSINQSINPQQVLPLACLVKAFGSHLRLRRQKRS